MITDSLHSCASLYNFQSPFALLASEPSEIGAIILSTFQERNLKLREAVWLIPGPGAEARAHHGCAVRGLWEAPQKRGRISLESQKVKHLNCSNTEAEVLPLFADPHVTEQFAWERVCLTCLHYIPSAAPSLSELHALE